MFEQPLIIDDLLPKAQADHIEKTLFSNMFPWFFMHDITYGERFEKEADKSVPKTIAFTHIYLKNKNVNSDYFKLIEPIWYACMSNLKTQQKIIMRDARSFLQVPFRNKPIRNQKHIDDDFEKHVVFLYYVNDVDGNTTLYKKENKEEILLEVTPKKNRVVIFDGAHYHCSSDPTLKQRAIVNFISLV